MLSFSYQPESMPAAILPAAAISRAGLLPKSWLCLSGSIYLIEYTRQRAYTRQKLSAWIYPTGWYFLPGWLMGSGVPAAGNIAQEREEGYRCFTPVSNQRSENPIRVMKNFIRISSIYLSMSATCCCAISSNYGWKARNSRGGIRSITANHASSRR